MKKVYIERKEKILKAAIKNENVLEECYIEEETEEPRVGEIYKGIVKNVVPAIKCAFIDIGFKKNCYMYVDKKFNNTHIKKNDELVVEIVKEAIDDKGSKVTNAVTLPGRYVVLETLNKNLSFSKKIKNDLFKEDVKNNVKVPKDIGIMIRTNGEKVSTDIINKEIEKLYETYCNIIKSSTYSIRPKLLYNNGGMLNKILRDSIDDSVDIIITDNEEDHSFIEEFLKLSPDINCQVKLYNERRTMFDYYGIEKEILSLRNRKVMLKSGGNIVIDKTEGMYVIDVNSAKNIKNSSIKDTALNINIEASYEIIKQIRLRNLGGIIIVDFIDMEDINFKNKILEILKKGFHKDKSKTVVYPFTELNLIQIARSRKGKTIYDYIEEKCSTCMGNGNRIKFSYLTLLIKNEIISICGEAGIKNIYIEIGSIYKENVIENIEDFVCSIGALEKNIYVNFVDNMELFKVEPLIFPNHIEKMQKFKIYG